MVTGTLGGKWCLVRRILCELLEICKPLFLVPEQYVSSCLYNLYTLYCLHNLYYYIFSGVPSVICVAF